MNFSSEASSTVDGVTPGTTSATYRYNVEATFCTHLVELQKITPKQTQFILQNYHLPKVDLIYT